MPDATTRYINAAQIVAFAPSIATTLKSDILYVSLLAQLLADKARFTTLSNWHHGYTSALTRMHWVRTSDSVHSITPDSPTATLTDLIDTAAMPMHAKILLMDTLRALRQPTNTHALTIFRQAVCKPHGHLRPSNLWFGLVQVTDASDIKTFALTVEAPEPTLSLDWSGSAFDTVPEGSIFKLRYAQCELAPAYDEIRAKVVKALGDKPGQYLSVIENAQDMPDPAPPLGVTPGDIKMK
ncbi:hypothetical protein G7007_05570 [Pseudomonas entomophila]|jgi:hypothetical protein|uniref:hypothetical protein n=1 Tax=Pseudomonas entomophila TaxID=312306 RepID=UPI0015E47FEB|nr:hypothetical protein [Pseudomonas entomophila]MBA1192333.1 hypothetical protein [Pseudomonas entomophila]